MHLFRYKFKKIKITYLKNHRMEDESYCCCWVGRKILKRKHKEKNYTMWRKKHIVR